MHPDLKNNSLAQWLEYLAQLHPKTIDMTLERAAQVRVELGLTQTCPVIIVGGTNGKGSVCAMLESILTIAGYHVGCYTSPHLNRYNERIRIRQKEVTNQQLCEAFFHVNQARENRRISLTFFEFSTLAAMHLFVSAQVDVAILEVGLGGRLDAVNIFDADCAILTSIALDHMDYLGDSRDAIGYEKAGIFRQNKPAICAEADLPCSIVQFAENTRAQLKIINQNFGYTEKVDHWNFWSHKGWRRTLPLPALRGAYQLQNASACLMALEMLGDQLPVSMQAIREGLLKVSLPGRFQVTSNQPMIILDVAHNPAAAQALAKNLKITQPSGKTYAVFAMLRDKDIYGVIQELEQHIDIWLLSSIDAYRGANADELLQNLYKLKAIRESHNFHKFENIESAYVFACEQADKNDRICVFGSFYTVGAVLGHQELRKGK
ncbi:dihydrofolate synthase / folylpolyglutamate synthase [Nitrosomonas aestuarii]|uniref:Dihydrofolate synthase/folylpolyglutamate synthase n=1 Tax=Nitrosomonas aestuarii TaxID=52441 RepID=A0A1I3YKD0_9PROT|nr:bifunctional tetrahydrofolate synthase/dihydrofolate synthase [Nitrosomonas aestuarii]SFK32282.1 dihydrofolate synthase / folylpolyglutamate synthase [Nitrosomonas aestuarii]